MRLDNYHPPKSSFLSVEKDMNLIINGMLSDQRLCKLLYYDDNPKCLTMPALTDEEKNSLIGKQIKNVPKLYVDHENLAYIIIKFDHFVTNVENPEFRDNLIEFDIVCHFNQWQLEDFQLRPFRIAAELDTLFNDKHLTGIGTLQFLGANQILLTDEFAGLCVIYEAIHGEEDKKGMLNPEDDKAYAEDFNEMIHYN